MRRRLLSLLVLMQFWPSTAVADQVNALSRIRSTDTQLLRALADGVQRSETLARLVSTVAASDLIVYLENRPCSTGLDGFLTFMTAAGGQRYLRIVLSRPLAWRLLPVLAHELQHAVEIARAPEVTSVQTLARFYARIGRHTCGGCEEQDDTNAAVAIGALVQQELARDVHTNVPNL